MKPIVQGGGKSTYRFGEFPFSLQTIGRHTNIIHLFRLIEDPKSKTAVAKEACGKAGRIYACFGVQRAERFAASVDMSRSGTYSIGHSLRAIGIASVKENCLLLRQQRRRQDSSEKCRMLFLINGESPCAQPLPGVQRPRRFRSAGR